MYIIKALLLSNKEFHSIITTYPQTPFALLIKIIYIRYVQLKLDSRFQTRLEVN